MSDRAAEARAEAERRNPLPECCDGAETHCRWHRQVERLREEFDEGRRWADANPQPRAITHDDIGAAYAVFMDAEGHPVRRFIVALKAIGIDVEDDE